MIRAYGLTKHYGGKSAKKAVDDLSFEVLPGTVTGFLGPNGAGKSTTMRMLIGLDAPTSGRATIGDRAYAGHPAPLHEVGALLEARSVHPGRSAYHHLMALAHTHSIPRSRVDAVLDLAGIHEVARRRVKGFSLGMGQRLGIAAALLGDPATVILDEPVNGLDPEGVLWIRNLLKSLAAEGRTVLVSSHLMSEMALTAEHLIIIGRGKLLADTTVERFVRESGSGSVKVVTPEAGRLTELLAGPDVRISGDTPGVLDVRGTDAEHIGRTAAAHGIPLFELTPHTASLEQAFMDLTRDSVDYVASTNNPVTRHTEGAAA
ncbi:MULTISPECIES: ATP-binding cassette domain-containing protein [unclassified Streptomyces]|uniref:ATP-binding cassette domain-containing protein n=1 Tax=unclassified Streptomyces TaxID=2593676 RepID=UPI001368723D|nr:MULTISPECIES: ATP-binding cassette domain-containing protein [unclassified Streptomyces]NEA03395.1 ATP-binding cassette domain-containing protein [Streptomyces sp. SID10116]MYY84978.1 ATP-binding cassette domain-containing protein [Streptomyces sp. SID335]MYZ15893.1 ATP-binding cassette domain-containing protein [Streptomyces sp. SID337]NDZ92122.1 ATP-binding cassette domain-containing protein [Streptomyces sp. SID10115]NEB46777.1 ATP-binding cassette domain-containing protein [Streptomyces